MWCPSNIHRCLVNLHAALHLVSPARRTKLCTEKGRKVPSKSSPNLQSRREYSVAISLFVCRFNLLIAVACKHTVFTMRHNRCSVMRCCKHDLSPQMRAFWAFDNYGHARHAESTRLLSQNYFNHLTFSEFSLQAAPFNVNSARLLYRNGRSFTHNMELEGN